MATSNFYSNCNPINVITLEDDWAYDDFVSCFSSVVNDKIKGISVSFYKTDKFPSEADSRSYPTSCLGILYMSKSYYDLSLEVGVSLLCRSGYYEHANLDFYPFIELEGDDVNIDIEDYIRDFYYGRGLPFGKAHGDYAKKWSEEAASEIISVFHEIAKETTDQYTVSYVFSNGETGYHNVNKLLNI